jgi:hypothetical protein
MTPRSGECEGGELVAPEVANATALMVALAFHPHLPGTRFHG